MHFAIASEDRPALMAAAIVATGSPSISATAAQSGCVPPTRTRPLEISKRYLTDGKLLRAGGPRTICNFLPRVLQLCMQRPADVANAIHSCTLLVCNVLYRFLRCTQRPAAAPIAARCCTLLACSRPASTQGQALLSAQPVCIQQDWAHSAAEFCS